MTDDPHERPTILWLTGANWDAIAGTDRRLVTALAGRARVVWVDPPISVLRRGLDGKRQRGDRMSHPMDGVTRLQTVGPPALTRPIARSFARARVAVQIRRALRRLDAHPDFVVLSFPSGVFPDGVGGKRLLYVTDNWIGGAELMGFSRTNLLRTLRRNAVSADLVLAVSRSLADEMESVFGVAAETLTNAADPVSVLPPPPAAGAPAILVGQLNERLDLDVLERITAAGLPMTVVGPRADRDPLYSRRLDAWLSAPGVNWIGAQPYDALGALLATASVGLTPYADSDFNRSSFPLKTLEYLGNGLPVVSTDIPATRDLGAGDDVGIARDPEDFVALVRQRIENGREKTGDERRLAFARIHSWDARARRLLELAGETGHSPQT